MGETDPGIPTEQRWRSHTYRLLARLLNAPPDAELLAGIADIDIAAADRPSVLAEAWQALIDATANSDVAGLSEEYHRLFIGITGGELLPYKSWYFTGFLMEKPLAELRSDLQTLGIERRPGVCEPEDHLAAIFETMALLIDSQNAQQGYFFHQHVESWGQKFMADLKRVAQSGLYVSIGHLGWHFIHTERNYFDQVFQG